MRTLFLLLCICAISACNKNNDNTINAPVVKTAATDPIDTLKRVYTGNVVKHSDWYYITQTGVDSGRFDTTYQASFTLVKNADKEIGISIDHSLLNYTVFPLDTGLMYSKGDPHHGGYYFVLTPSADSVYYYNGSYGGYPPNHSNTVITFSGKK